MKITSIQTDRAQMPAVLENFIQTIPRDFF